MGADEEGTHERLQAHLRELVNPKIEEPRGRIVKNTGDGFLAEFPSVVDAVRCAVEIQRGMADREPEIAGERRIRFRIGINLGDVIVEERDIFGDGVNVAARLEALAEPGGICVSRVVRDQVRDKLDLTFEDMGEQSVKNIARPLRVYALRSEAVSDLLASSVPPAVSIAQPTAAPRLSIVVLPFANLSNDPEQQYFADGITEDLTTDLSRIASMLVISRNTALTYRNKAVDTKQIGRELCVRYVLEGSVRQSGNRVRVNAQLIDAETDTHLWAERFDGDTSDLFTLQDEVASRIANALGVELIAAEAARPTVHPDALDYILRARAVGTRGPSRENYAERVNLLERTLAVDPLSAEAQSLLGLTLTGRVLDGMTDSPAADLERAEGLARQALAASPRSPLAHHVKGQLLRAQRRIEEAIPEYETAIALDRNSVSALAYLGLCKFLTGTVGDAIALLERAIRLSPRDPFVGVWFFQIGRMHLLQSRTDEAVLWLEKARSAAPEHSSVHAFLASAYALKGETGRAAAELAEARRLSPDRFTSIARLNHAAGFNFGVVSKVRGLHESTFFAGLRKAGMPED
jgi:adenylate cyclase